LPPTKHILSCDRCDGRTGVTHPTASDMVFKGSVIPIYKRTRRCLDCGSLMTTVELRVLNLLPDRAKEPGYSGAIDARSLEKDRACPHA
jgi:hypothetical protein